MKISCRLLFATSCAILLAASASAQPQNPGVSAEPTVFREVTAKLDAGGCLYAYLSTSQWTAGLAAKIREIQELVSSLPGISSDDQTKAKRIFALIENVVQHSGLESVAGVGISGIALEPGFYRTRTVVQRGAKSGDGYLWRFFGTNPHALAGLDWLPGDTVYAAFGDVDLKGIWEAVKTEAKAAQFTDATRALEELSGKVQSATGRSLEEQLNSFAGEVGVAVLLDPSRTFTLPLQGTGLDLPEPALLIAIKVKDDVLFNWLDQMLASNPQSIPGERDGARWRSIDVPAGAPFPIRPTVARVGEYLWLSSTDRALEKVLAVQSGSVAGLKGSTEFKHLSHDLPEQGTSFAFVGRRFGDTLGKLQEAVLKQAGSSEGFAPPADLLRKLTGFGSYPISFTVGLCDGDGFQSASQGNQEPAGAIISSALVAPTAVMAGMLLPALAKAKAKAQEIQCFNNLKQIGLALRIYAVDHDDTLPPDFASIQNELITPRVLVCPLDPGASDRLSSTWSDFDAAKCSYDYLKPGIKDSEPPDTAVVRCRFHGSVVLLDGSVHRGQL